jgi:hypothetical protein
MLRKLLRLFCPAFILLAILTGCASQTVQEGDKAPVVRATDLAQYGYAFKQISKYETFNKMKYADGSVDLEYEFETPETEQNAPLYMLVVLNSVGSNSDAIFGESVDKTLDGLALKWQDMKQKPVKNAKKYGSSSALNLITYQGQPVGNYFICRQGKRTYSITIMGGFYVDDPAVWDELVRTKVNNWINTPAALAPKTN